MALKLLTEKEKERLIKAVIRAAKNVQVMTNEAYNFLYQSNGFIAHYSIHGFKEHYEDNSLKADVLKYQCINQYSNFHPGDECYECRKQRRDIYNEICRRLM